MNRARPRRCACGLALRDGVCPGGCDQHRAPARRAQATVAKQRQNEKRALEVVGIGVEQARAGLARLNQRYAKHLQAQAERARRGWRSRS